jgi:hypothetical protein
MRNPNAERDARILAMRPASFDVIAAALGISRNVVAGVVHRGRPSW